MTDDQFAKAIYDHQRTSALGKKRIRGARIPTWEQLSAPERSRRVLQARQLRSAYERAISGAREVRLVS